jgi:hypothetical protein
LICWTWWHLVMITKLRDYSLWFYSDSCNFLPLRSKNSPQHFVLNDCSSVNARDQVRYPYKIMLKSYFYNFIRVKATGQRKSDHLQDTILVDSKPSSERDPQHTAQCIYSFSCECGRSYFGETGRPLAMRLREHKYNLQQGLLGNSN